MKVLVSVLVFLALALAGCAADAAEQVLIGRHQEPAPTLPSTELGPTPGAPIPQSVPTATPLPPSPRTVYVIDPNQGERISRILVIDPDRPRQKGSFSTRYTPDLAFSPDGRRMFVADTYWTQVTRGEARDVLSVYDAASGRLLVDDQSIPGRLLYKVYPLGDPNLFFSGDGRRLFSLRYGDPVPDELRLAILDAEDLEVLHEGPAPLCGHRIQAQADRWICVNSLPTGANMPGFQASLSLDAVDPWSGARLETLLTMEDLGQSLSSLAATSDGSLLYVIDRGRE